MINFKNITFPENESDNPLEAIGLTNSEHVELFTKLMESSRDLTSKSQVIKKIMSDCEFTDNEMKLIFLLAYDRATAIITENAETEFKK